MRYAMAIDLGKCIGCKACAVACKSNNNLPNGIWWNRVDPLGGDEDLVASGTYPDSLTLGFQPVACQHCDNPPCVAACPAEATWKRDEDGIVFQDNVKCIGCKLCIDVCPYDARSFNEDEPSYPAEHAFGDADAPEHIAQRVEKCTFCINRLERGGKPACMELCLGRCRFWGDLDDPNSEISVYLTGKQTFQLLAERGTSPSTVYVK
jgi:molybdopterin-containing oxidoreductase family iron-sulfur binding subunit